MVAGLVAAVVTAQRLLRPTQPIEALGKSDLSRHSAF